MQNQLSFVAQVKTTLWYQWHDCGHFSPDYDERCLQTKGLFPNELIVFLCWYDYNKNFQILGKNGLVEWVVFQEQLRKHRRFKNNVSKKNLYNFLSIFGHAAVCQVHRRRILVFPMIIIPGEWNKPINQSIIFIGPQMRFIKLLL